MSNKVKKPRPYVWKLVLFILFAFSVVDASIVALATKDPQMVGGIVGAAILTALFGYLWWKTRDVDKVLRAKTDEQKLQLLQKITDQKQLFRIAKASVFPVQEAALERITDPAILVDAARKFDDFALEHIRDPEVLVRAITEPYFFRKRGSDYEYQKRVEAAREKALALLTDPDALMKLARREGTLTIDAVKKLLQAHPELALAVYADKDMPQGRRDAAEEALIRQTKRQIEARPQSAKDLFLDRTLPPKARLAALEGVPEAELPSLYDREDKEKVRQRVVDRIRDQEALAAIIEQEPNKSIRLSAETRITDLQRRKLYCQRDGAHLWQETGNRWESYGDWHYEYVTYRCPYCGMQREEEGESRKD